MTDSPLLPARRDRSTEIDRHFSRLPALQPSQDWMQTGRRDQAVAIMRWLPYALLTVIASLAVMVGLVVWMAVDGQRAADSAATIDRLAGMVEILIEERAAEHRAAGEAPAGFNQDSIGLIVGIVAALIVLGICFAAAGPVGLLLGLLAVVLVFGVITGALP